MQIKTGKAPISVMALVAIWSISLVVNLPGLAITPMMGNLTKIFPGTSQLEIQLLTVLPNLFIIPFVLMSGRLSLSRNKVGIVVAALIIYLASGIAYLFARNMVWLIVISCALGCGCGLLIPLAAGLLADTFAGKYRMQQMGIKSGISNMALVIATFVVGWLSHGNWRLPFLVYLLPAIPLVLTPFLHKIPADELDPPTLAKAATPPDKIPATDQYGSVGKVRHGFFVARTWALIGVYFFTCYSTVIVSYYTPFLMQGYGMSDSQVGTVTAIFFLAVFLPGFILPWILKVFRQPTLPICTLIMAGGIILMVLGHSFWLLCVAASMVGIGYGVFQPIIYDKATQTVTNPAKSTLALAFVLAANYVAVSATPFIVDGILRPIFHARGSDTYPFILNAVLLGIFAIIVILCRKSFVFKIDESYY